MAEIITLGETMVSFTPQEHTGLAYGPALNMRIAGAESNTAIGLCRMGHSVAFISRVGTDSLGQFVLRSIRAEGVDTTLIGQDAEHPTGIMFKEPKLHAETTVYYYRTNSAASHMSCEDIPEQEIEKAEILHFTGITPILSPSCRQMVFHAMEIAAAHGCAVSFDPNIRLKLWKDQDYTPLMLECISRASYLLAGLDECKILYHTDDIEHIAKQAFVSDRLQCLALKDGSRGAWICDRQGICQIPPAECVCVDPVGAGDAFNAGFLSGILEGKSFVDSGVLGAFCGARATETYGDTEGLLTKAELEYALQHINPVCR